MFVVTDVRWFYVAFEAVLIPMYRRKRRKRYRRTKNKKCGRTRSNARKKTTL